MKSKPRTFERFPQQSFCPICGTNEDGECLLLGKDGTADDGIEEAVPVHLWCAVATRYNATAQVIYGAARGGE